jgi:indolepyruvate decarboxylase
MNISHYLLARLKSLGVDHMFGIPGDYILPFFEEMMDSDVLHVAPCNELNGGYAADGYARLRGLGAIAVTYGPGSFSLVNAIAGAYAERVPLVVISGGPPRQAYKTQPYLHHVLPHKFEASLRIFEQITVDARCLHDPDTATTEIDALLKACLTESRPVYLEFPLDLQRQACSPPGPFELPGLTADDEHAVKAAVELVAERVARSERCVGLAGHEIHQARLQDKVLALMEHTGLRVASMFTGKAEFLEHHPNCVGVYHGIGSPPRVREFVESADTVLFLGAVPSDFNMGGASADLTEQQCVHIFDGQVTTVDGSVANVRIADVVAGLLNELPEAICAAADAPLQEFIHKVSNQYEPIADQPMTNSRFYDRLAHFFQANDIVLADAGPSINMTYLQLPAGTRYISSSYWASIGAGFGHALGACFAAAPGQRVIALEGDGSFQMTAQEISTMQRYGKPAIIFVVNNKGYTAERLIHDGPFNDLQDWKYHRLPEAFGGVVGSDVHTEGDFEAALQRAATHTGPGPLVIEVHLDPWDVSEAFARMSEGLRSR